MVEGFAGYAPGFLVRVLIGAYFVDEFQNVLRSFKDLPWYSLSTR